MASPTERGVMLRPYFKDAATYNGKPLLPKGSQVVTPEDIQAGYRVLTPEQAETDVQADVREFHKALDVPCGCSPALRRPELRASLIEEEAKETVDAIRAGDFTEAIDGLCDLLCVVYGAAVEWGIDLAPFWREVHRTNMAKQGGPVREDGKRLKPEGWTPPDIAGVLARVPGKDSGNITCEACGAVVAWEGEPPADCLKCGALVGKDSYT